MLPSLRTVFLLILAIAPLVAACGGGSTPGNRATETPAPTPVLEGLGKDLVDLLDRGTQVQYKVGYRVHSPEGEEGDGYVIYNRPPLTRIDTVSPTLQAVTSLVIGGNEETQTISCSGGVNRWKCSKIDPLGPSLLRAAGPIVFPQAVDVDQLAVTETAHRTVAGEDARCFSLRPDTSDETSEIYCVRADGVALFAQTATGTVEAWAVSDAVSDDAFTPPAEPQEP